MWYARTLNRLLYGQECNRMINIIRIFFVQDIVFKDHPLHMKVSYFLSHSQHSKVKILYVDLKFLNDSCHNVVTKIY